MKPLNLNLKRPILLLFIYCLLPQLIFTATCPLSHSLPSTTCTIGASQMLSSSDLSIPSGTRHMCYSSNIFIDDLCSQTLSEGNFFSVYGKYDGTNYKMILKVYWTSGNTLALAGIDSSDTVTDVFTIPQGQPSQLQISVYACIDLVYGRIYGAINTPTESNSGLTSIADYAINLANMDDFMFYLCANSYSATCTFSKSYVSFPDDVADSLAAYVWGGLSPTLLRSFNIDEGSGTTLTDSSFGGTATFGSGSAAPSWSKTNRGVVLTSANQYISLPGTTFAAGDDLITQSYTITTWVRLTSTPTADSYIFRHTDSTGSQEKFAVKVASNNMAAIVTGGSAVLNTLPINTGQWTHLAATISLKSDGKNYLKSMVLDGTPTTREGFAALNIAITFSASDLLTIGGGSASALATFYRFQIYSPGSHITQSGSCSNPSATYSLGLTQQLLEYSCNNDCLMCYGTGASTCMSCATSSYGIYSSSCTSCPATTSKIDTLCSDCPENCDSCSSLTTCQTCSTGYQTDSAGQCVNSTNTTEPEALPLTTFAKRSSSASKTGTTSSDVSTQVVTVVATGDPVAVQAQVSGRLFVSIQYFKITYSTDILNILKETSPKPGKGDPSYVPNVSDKIKSGFTSRDIPSAFSNYGVSSSFILNFWKKMILIAIVTAIIMLLSSIEYGMALNRRSPHKLQILVRELAQNYLLTQLYSVLGEIMLYSTLQYRSLHFSSRSEWFDLIISLVFLSLVFIVPLWHFQFLNKYQKIKESAENKKSKESKEVLENFQATNVGVKLFYDLFKDENKYQQSFLIFLAGRDVIFSLLLTLLFDHPLAQMLILLAMNIAMISYLLVLKPFKNVFNLAQQLFYEALFFVALITLILLIALDNHYPNDQDNRDTLSRIIIYETLIFKYGTLVITGLKVGMQVLDAIKDYKKKKALEAAKPEAAKLEAAKPEAKRLETEGAPLKNGESSPPRKIEDDMDEEGYPMAMLSPTNNNNPNTFARLSTQNSPVHSRYQNNAHAGALQNENTDVIDISPMNNYRDQKGFNEEPSPNNYEQNALIRTYSPNENNDYSPIEMRERKSFNAEPPRSNDNYDSGNHSRKQSNFNENPYQNNYQQEPYQNNYQQEPYQNNNYQQEPYGNNNYQQDKPSFDHENDYASIDVRNRNSYNEGPPRSDNNFSRNHSRHQSNFNQDPYQSNNYQQEPYQNPHYQQEPYHNNNYQQDPYQNNYYQQNRPPYSENRSDGPQYDSRKQSYSNQ